ncbi:phage baseplate assembly protein V [Pedococcus dokdonensis]|uniref:phage baseplate assembly protein V n=1 Tax=Pedococcus dokdonensis TaxID=443156 RepID=UPI0012FDC6FF|nr:phage baseplate assembly protein V [Pedococcus dokdonensis]
MPDRDRLHELVGRARTDLRAWTDSGDADPGVALVELFAYVGDLLASYSDRVADEAYLGGRGRYTSVVQQQGRVGLDTDWDEGASRRLCGVHRAVVVDDVDPLLQRRLLLRIPDVSGDATVWAAACLPVDDATDLPAIGAGVWVAFEAGNAAYPVWLGQRAG